MNKRKSIPDRIKKQLIKEAGNKCANPGCPNSLTEFHHIREWAVHKTHDQRHMVAICPACHDNVSRGKLRIDDETLYNWKKIARKSQDSHHIYVEPGSPVRLLLGSLAVETLNKTVVFELLESQRLEFEVIDSDIVLIDFTMKSLEGETLLKMTKNHIKYNKLNDDIEVRARAGKFQLILKNEARKLIPTWITRPHLLHGSDYFATQEYNLIDIEVLEPGLVRIYGVWMDKVKAVVISPIGISILGRDNEEVSLTLAGEGKESVLRYVGPINGRLFNIV
jgi:hypothetical protein